MVHTESPANFVVQLDSDRRISDRISFDLSKIYDIADRNAACALEDQFMHEGVPVAARYMIHDDLRWFRAIIVGVDKTPGKERPIRIRFVDFGNHQQNERHHLKMMPIDMGNHPPLAIKCRIKGKISFCKFLFKIRGRFLF